MQATVSWELLLPGPGPGVETIILTIDRRSNSKLFLVGEPYE